MKKRIVYFILLILLCMGIGTGLYLGNYYHAADPLPEENLVRGKDYIAYEAPGSETGLIFYPGAKVEYISYAPLMKELSEQNVTCVLLKMPGNIAFFDINAADRIPEQFPDIKSWYLAGHSLGGVAAALYGEKHADEYEGLIFLASYSTKDLKDTNLKVLSIYGDQDKVLNLEKYQEAEKYLPADAREIIIAGGNHSGFGNYGEQKKDGAASITREEQQKITVDEISNFLYDEE